MDARDGIMFSTADLFDQQPDSVEIIDLQFQSFGRHQYFYGPIETLCVSNDHHAVGDAAASPGHSRVLVIDCAGTPTAGLMGDRIASMAVENGWVGAVIAGLVRDSQAINQLPFAVRALGTTARRSTAQQEGQRGIQLRLGGVCLTPGDWLYADHDAIIVSKNKLEFPEAAGVGPSRYALTSDVS